MKHQLVRPISKLNKKFKYFKCILNLFLGDLEDSALL